jgi:predicted nuclease of predicted toxin-antitoxin system
MLRLLIDENFNNRILQGLKSRLPELDFVTVKQVGLAGFKDPLLLEWAAQNDRTILTHDTKTMRPDAAQLLHRGETIAGLIVVPQTMQ